MTDLAKAEGKQVIFHKVMLGCDPELFFEQGGKIIGAEKVIGEEGLSSKKVAKELYSQQFLADYYSKDRAFVLDGVQIEMNPNPHYCRENLATEFKIAFKTLKRHLAGMTGITASFRSVVELDKKELEGLSDKAKILGCAPSNNIYDSKASISVDPKTYTKRSAGGHIHVGLMPNGYYSGFSHLMTDREMLVPLMDVLVGLPSVLIDRDPLAAERRKVYGRAGEHRLPAHGVEYRTLSNYWIRSYQLMSMVMGLSRLAVSILGTENHSCRLIDRDKLTKNQQDEMDKPYVEKRWPAAEILLGMVDLDQVKDAINNNDLELAKVQFEHVKSFIREHVREGSYGLNAKNLPAFEAFIAKIHTNGIESWFPQDPVEHWCNLPEVARSGRGFEGFMGAILENKPFETVYKGE